MRLMEIVSPVWKSGHLALEKISVEEAPTSQLTALASAELLLADYRNPKSLDTLAALEIGGVAARIVLASGAHVLIITGTNSRRDWHAFNFRWWPIPHVTEGETRRWHRGFLRHAETCFAFAKGWLEHGGTIDLIAGHSLGGAAAQIVGSSLKITTHTFGSPKPLFTLFDATQPAGAENVTNWRRADDLVCHAPPIGFSPVALPPGKNIALPSPPMRFGLRHEIEQFYIELLKAEDAAPKPSPPDPGLTESAG